MATAKKAAVKKAATKKAAAKKVAAKKTVERKPKPVPVEVIEATQADLDLIGGAQGTEAVAKKRGRPAGTTTRRKKRKALPEFLYSIRQKNDADDLGLDDDTPKATSIMYVGPFASEADATKAALDEVGVNAEGVEIIVFRDIRRGTPETKVRLVS